jgi:transposase InsO family protein
MQAIDELHLAYPQFGSRNIVYWLQREGWPVNRKRVQRLMRKMGLEGLMPKRRWLSRPHPEHPVYPYRCMETGALPQDRKASGYRQCDYARQGVEPAPKPHLNGAG